MFGLSTLRTFFLLLGRNKFVFGLSTLRTFFLFLRRNRSLAISICTEVQIYQCRKPEKMIEITELD